MPRTKKTRRARLLVIVLAVVLVAGVAVAGYLGVRTIRASFPQTTGQIRVSGLSGPVQVRRDANGIPQIYADTPADLFKAQGYVQAQDRFWQMDVDRHITSGTLSEMFGAGQVETDAYIRTMDWHGVAQREYDTQLSAATKSYLRSFSDGVNAWLAEHPGGAGASLEYALLGTAYSGYKPTAWTPVDSLSWLKAMAWDFSGNMQQQIQRALLAENFSKQQIAQLYPDHPYAQNGTVLATGTLRNSGYVPDTTSVTTTAARTAAAATASGTTPAATPGATGGATGGSGAVVGTLSIESQLAATLAKLPALLGSAGQDAGSSAWVVSGSHTSTGKPLLANDPHATTTQPSVWYQVGLHCTTVDANCPFDATGYAFPAMPGVVIGHNQAISWGVSGLGADDQDLYLEDVTGSGTYLKDGRNVAFQERQETIAVAGSSARHITVRVTDNGPLLSDHSAELQAVGAVAPTPTATAPDRGSGYGVALHWSALTPGRSMDAVFDLDRATDFNQFRAAAREFTAPALGLVYADTSGTIGYQATGDIPVHSADAVAAGDGAYPLPGWDSAYDWKKTSVPQSALPWSQNPATGFVVAADQPVVDATYPYALAQDADYGDRAARITTMIRSKLAGGGRISTDDTQQIQNDDTSTMASTLIPYLLRIDLRKYLGGTDVKYVQDAQNLLKDWNYQQDSASAAAAYYNAVWRNLVKLAFELKFPQTLEPVGDCKTVPEANPAQLSGDDVNGTTQKVRMCGLLPIDQAQPDGGDRWATVVSALLDQPGSTWWNYSSRAGTTTDRDKLLAQAMRNARYELTSLMGKSISGWSWGRIHTLELREQTLGTQSSSWLAGIFHHLLNRGPYQVNGDASAELATGWNASVGYTVDWVPTMRMIVDLSDLDASQWINLGGASGHTFDAHYDDQTLMWDQGQYLPWAYGADAVKKATKDDLVLTPTG